MVQSVKTVWFQLYDTKEKVKPEGKQSRPEVPEFVDGVWSLTANDIELFSAVMNVF